MESRTSPKTAFRTPDRNPYAVGKWDLISARRYRSESRTLARNTQSGEIVAMIDDLRD